MSLFPRLLTLLLLTAGMAHLSAATTASSKSKSKGKGSTSSPAKSGSGTKSGAAAKSKSQASSPAKPDTPAEKKAEQAVPKEDTPKEPRPAAVSTMSIEEIAGFDKYPKQVQSLVQSALALTHLELRYMYGSHEPNKGGMDCSGTIYHVLHFQGLKDVPRQSDEMAMWVEKKSGLHLTPTATNFDSPEFAGLKPGDLLFWTNTTATTRKLPVTHVMVYLGKRKSDGKRIIFGASDGRSFSGMRRSGVSVFDFHLPRAEGTARLHGYGPAPGLLPADATLAAAKPAAPPPSPTPAATAPAKEEPAQAPAKVAAVQAKPSSPQTKAGGETKPATEMPVITSTAAAKTPAAPPAHEAREEVRKAMAVGPGNDGTGEAAETPAPVAAAKGEGTKAASNSRTELKKVVSASPSGSKPKASTASKSKSGTTSKKKSTQVSSSSRRTPAPPPKSQVEQAFDRAVNSVRRVFR